jgi:hypothetical protein
MRRTISCQILLVLAVLVSAATASAVPRVTIKLRAVPIPRFPGTGNILGAGAEVESVVTITGGEYAGAPSPLTGISVYSPAGVKVSSAGFVTCAPSVLEADGPEGCSKRSMAGPLGEGLGVVSFGSTRIREKVTLQPFFAPGGGLSFYAEGLTPAYFQVVERAKWVPSAAPYGPGLITEVPLIETVPDGYDASILSFKLTLGGAYKKGKKTVSYFTLPKNCPKHGAPAKSVFKFLSGESVTVIDQEPCPRHK